MVTNTRVQVARSIVWTSLESFGVSGLSIIGLIVVARYISPSEMGVAAMAQGIVQLLMVPVEFLFLDALIRRKDVDQNDYNTAHSASVFLGISISLLCWLSSGAIANLLNVPEMEPVLAWMGVSIAVMGFATVITAQKRREMEFRVLAIRSFVGRLAGVSIGIAIALMGGGVWSLVAQQVLMVTFGTLALWLQVSARPSFGFSWICFKELVAFGARSVAAAWVYLSIPRVFMLFVGACLSTTAAGYMNLAFRVVDILRDIVVNAVAQLALPMFSRHSDDLPQLKNIFITAVRFTCAVTFPMFAGLALCSTEFIHFVFGVKWDDAAPYITLLSLLTLVHFTRLYSSSMLAAKGYPHLPLMSDCSALLAVLVGMVVLILLDHMTLEHAALVWALRLLVSVPVDMGNIRRIVRIDFYDQVKGAFIPLVCVAVMAIGILSVETIIASLEPWLRLVIMAVTGVAVYTIALAVLDRNRITELWHFAHMALRRQA